MANYADRRAWALTAAEAKLDELKKQQATADRINKIYRAANKQIQERVQDLYNELATQDEKNAWRFEGLNTPATVKSAAALRKKIESAGLTEYVPERLQRRLSVYEVMELDNWYTMTKAGQDAHKTLKNALGEKIKDQGEIWQRALGAGGAAFVGFDRNQIGYMLGENWYGGNFSSRLWDETQASWSKVQEEIAKAMASGQDPGTTRRKLAEILGPAYRGTGPKGINYAVERIMRTEMARSATQADLIKWKDEGVTEVQWNATLEAHTCDDCAERDGKIYKLSEALEIVPLHPNCRCFLTPYDRELAESGKDERMRQYKNDQGEYELVAWAPMSEFTKGHTGYDLASAVMQTAGYFLNKSPVMQYEPTRTGLEYTGDLTYEDGAKANGLDDVSQTIVNLAEETIQTAADKYPEIMDEINRSYGGKIKIHRGYELINEKTGAIETAQGATLKKYGKEQGYMMFMYPYKKGMTGLQVKNEMAELARIQKATGAWSTGKVNHTFFHEIGHTLGYNLEWRGGDLGKIIKEATNSTNMKTALKRITGNISVYGGKTKYEAFAELFAKSMAQDATDSSVITERFVRALNNERAKFPEQKAKTTKISIK